MAREPRRFLIVNCFDCNYAGNRWETDEDTILGQHGWVDVEWNTCPECGEPCGPAFEAVEVMVDDPQARE